MAFSPPQGVTFHTEDEIAVNDLCMLLRQTAVFLQGLQLSSPTLCLYHDWWQHDGLHFEHGTVTFHDLFTMVATPRSIFESTPADHEVFVGVAPEDASWYLRFRAEWDADGQTIAGSFAVTVPPDSALAFAAAVAVFEHGLVQESADKYYERVIV